MPSASTTEKQPLTEPFDPLKKIVTIVEKKIRNLEKRKGKLDTYPAEKLDCVIEVLDFSKELLKLFQGVVRENTKIQKKATRRELIERQRQELQRIKEIMVYQDLLNSMGGDDVRQDFLEGNKGAVKLTEEELNTLDELYKSICPERDPESEYSTEFNNALSSAAEHIQNLLNGKDREAFGTTYKGLRETLQKIHTCSYFNKPEEEVPNETESTQSESKEENKNFQEAQPSEAEDFAITQKSDEYVLQKSGGTIPHGESPYYPVGNAPVYPDQAHPIQEVLSGQGNLNFLQESQIEKGAPVINQQSPASLPGATYANVQYTPAPQSIAAANLASQHRTKRPSEEATVLQNHSPTLISNSVPIQQQPQPNIPMQPTTQPTDFDPGRPIPTQTYTNQSFSSVVHPMMAVPQNYVPASLPHGISPAHVLPSNMVLPSRNAVSNPNPLPMSAAQASVSGLSTAPALSQQANIYSLRLKMNQQQLNTDSSQPAHVPPQSYDNNNIQESNVAKHPAAVYGNGRGNHTSVSESRTRPANVKPLNNAYVRASGQVEYGNDRAYQSTNNSQGYMNRENFVDSSSYSSNLKRGLASRGGARVARGAGPRGDRVGYRN
ncbi:caprin-1 [Trichonephila inaurata madagascariensis]|uniref:Caprin-1 n=1 Tax=Trichonephila inaurata madagascariensis TaxID=2747483 RepID=A0A8X6IF24_9ARAC|nr:caprin-1 [Trichonephila inaurata madagascariensis]